MNAEARPEMKRTFHSEESARMRRALISFAMRVLRPVIRVLMRYGLSYPELNQICRWLAVDIAMAEKEFFLPRRRRQFKARVACLTALSRKEVLRLYSSPCPDENDALVPGNRAGRVLEGWLCDAGYLDANGKPMTIPFRASDGRRSFSALVAEHSGDIPPRAILDELVRAGCCEMISEDEVRMYHDVYVMRPLDTGKIEEAGRIAARALAEVDHMLATSSAGREELPGPVREDAEIDLQRPHAIQ